MKQVYHILNGDALKSTFPEQLLGERIVARECLVDGDVSGETLEEFYFNRAKFLTIYSEDSNANSYFEKAVPEFQKMQSIPDGSEINLWFEDDLFCQVNLWFVLYLLSENNRQYSIYLVRPTSSLQFGFGGMDTPALVKAFEYRIIILQSELSIWKTLWLCYQKNNTVELLKIAEGIKEDYLFILPAVHAHIDRLPNNNKVGRPERVLIEIMKELKTDEFGQVFREFCEREPIYGFGDLQVKRLWKQIVDKDSKP